MEPTAPSSPPEGTEPAEPVGTAAPEATEPGLNEVEERTLAAVLAHPLRRDAAKALGISERGLRNRLAKATLAQAFRAARQQQLAEVTERLAAAGGDAVAALQAVLKDGEAPPAAKVSAARTVLELLLRAGDQDLAEQVAQLEELVRRGAH